jgi:glycerol kinase
MMTQSFGAIDQGTTSTRAVRVEADGTVRITQQLGHGTRFPAPGHVEMDATELLGNVIACAESLGDVAAIGLANQGESCLAWDARTKEPLSPVLSWQDSRGNAILQALKENGLADEIEARSGLPLDPYFSASKLAWLLRSGGLRGPIRLGTTDAFFLDRLCGTFATDIATASRTGLLDMSRGNWDQRLCDIYGLPPEALPEIRPNLGTFGTLAGRPVTAAIVDQQAALYGHGAQAAGDAKFTFGTGGFALGICDAPAGAIRDRGLLPTVAWDLGTGPVMAFDGGVRDAGTAVDWLRDSGLEPDLAALGPAEPLRAERGLVCLPLFSGLGAPDWEHRAGPIMLGFTRQTTGHDLARATLEGIAWLAARVVTAAEPLMPGHRAIRIDGGVARSDHFLQALADFSGRDLLRVADAERTALGAALLAARAIGAKSGWRPAAPAAPFSPRTVDPATRQRLDHALTLSRAPLSA